MPALKSKSNSSLLKARAEQARRGRGIIPSATHPNPQSSPEPISSGTRARVIDTRALEVELEEIKSKNIGLQERNEALEVLITELNIKLEELEIARLKSHQDAESSALRSLELQESLVAEKKHHKHEVKALRDQLVQIARSKETKRKAATRVK